MLNTIYREIAAAYGSLEQPSWTFVESRYRAQPYAALINQLRQHYSIVETTDLNDDVCVALVCKANDRSFGVNLSLIGPYAMCFVLDGDATAEMLQPLDCSGDLPAESAVLCKVLADHGVTVLAEQLLNSRVRFRADPGNTNSGFHSLKHILFSTTW